MLKMITVCANEINNEKIRKKVTQLFDIFNKYDIFGFFYICIKAAFPFIRLPGGYQKGSNFLHLHLSS